MLIPTSIKLGSDSNKDLEKYAQTIPIDQSQGGEQGGVHARLRATHATILGDYPHGVQSFRELSNYEAGKLPLALVSIRRL